MNKIIIKGRITKDVEVRYTQTSNTAVVTFTVAVNRDFVKQGEERQTDFINCVAYSKTAEFISKYFGKGQEILLVGRIQTRNYEDDNGQKHYVTEVIVENVEFCGSKKEEKEENQDEYEQEERFAIQNENNLSTEEDDERVTFLIKRY